jgi:hypothetical protein
MKNKLKLSCLIACAAAFVLAGCQEKTETEKAVDATKSAAEQAGDSMKDAAAKTGDAVKDAAAKTGEVLKDAADTAIDATKEGAKKVGETATNIVGEIKAKLN